MPNLRLVGFAIARVSFALTALTAAMQQFGCG
jgi:hypothetical protein